jgi:hypothetical protein
MWIYLIRKRTEKKKIIKKKKKKKIKELKNIKRNSE